MSQMVVGPDGIQHIFPDNATPEQMTAAIKSAPAYNIDSAINKIQGDPQAGWFDKNVGLPVMKFVAPVDRFIEGATSRAANAATLGFSDEAAGAGTGVADALKTPQNNIASVVSGNTTTPGKQFEQGYLKGAGADRTRQAQFGEDNPKLATTLDILGAFGGMGPGGAIAAPVKAATTLGKIGLYGAKIAKGAATGAAFGATSGFGNATGSPEERLAGAERGAAGGAAFGAAANPVLDAVGGAFKLGKNILGIGSGGASGAKTAIINALAQDGLTPQQALAKFNNWMLTGAKPETLADLGGDSMRRLARSVYTAGGEGANTAKSVLQGRLDTAPDRIASDLETTMGAQGNSFGVKDALDASRSRAARPLYQQAYAANPGMSSAEIDAVLGTPAGKKALSESTTLMANDGIQPTPSTNGHSLQQLDYAKRALDDQIGAAQRAGNANEARVLVGLKNRLLTAMDAADTSGAYAQARSAWSGPTQSMNAVDAGQAALKGIGLAPEQITKEFSALSPGDQEYYKLGMIRALRDQMGGAGGPNKILAAFGPGNRYGTLPKQLQAVFGSPAEFQKLSDLLGREANMAQTARTALGGSDSIPKAVDMESPSKALDMVKDIGGAVVDTVGTAGSLFPAAKLGAKWLSSLAARAGGMNQAKGGAIAPLLFGQNPSLPLNDLIDQALLRNATASGQRAGQKALPAALAVMLGPRAAQLYQ